jgi:hypothetical protein
MDDSELFDVFKIESNPEPIHKPIPTGPRDKRKYSDRKSSEKSSIGLINGANVAVTRRSSEENAQNAQTRFTTKEIESFHTSKRSRRANQVEPIVVDSFETETDQIVPATQGLQGIAPTDQNIIIKKRVSLPNKAIIKSL